MILASLVYQQDDYAARSYLYSSDFVEIMLGPNIFSFNFNSPVEFVDAWGTDSIIGPGKLCTDKKCNKDKCKAQAKRLPENGWEDDMKNGKDPWRDVPDPGKCLDADGVATPKGVLKIPDNMRCTIKCDSKGSPNQIICHGIGSNLGPRWRPSLNPPYFPPNPFGSPVVK